MTNSPSNHIYINNGTIGKDPFLNVTITKDVAPGCKGPQIIITIKAPEKDEINRSIVISLDTSGSFGTGGRPEYGAVLREVMPEVLKHIEEKDRSCRIAIVSWDDDIDFAYGPKFGKDIKKVELMPISVAISNLANIFDSNDCESELPYPIGALDLSILNRFMPFLFAHPTNRYNDTDILHFWENESTNLSLGVLSAQEVLRNQKAYKYNYTRILLITGRSEFFPVNESEIRREIIRSGSPISVVGFGVPYDSDLNKTLCNITSISNGDKPYYTPGILSWTKGSMLHAINYAVDDIMNSKNIITNITINEVLYPYLKISSINVMKDRIPIDYYKNITYNRNDNSTTLNIRWNKSLNSSEELKIIIGTELNMSLPVEVSKMKREISYKIDPATSPSSVAYYWQDREMWTVALPEKRVI